MIRFTSRRRKPDDDDDPSDPGGGDAPNKHLARREITLEALPSPRDFESLDDTLAACLISAARMRWGGEAYYHRYDGKAV